MQPLRRLGLLRPRRSPRSAVRPLRDEVPHRSLRPPRLLDRGNGPSHQGLRSIQRLRARYRNLLLVHGPIRTNWLNQVEIYFSVPHREALTPNAFTCSTEARSRLDTFRTVVRT